MFINALYEDKVTVVIVKIADLYKMTQQLQMSKAITEPSERKKIIDLFADGSETDYWKHES